MLQRFDGASPQVHPEAWVHPSAVVIGLVELAARASVWPCVVLRGDMGWIRVGEDTNLQDGTIAHDTADLSETRIGARCTIGHRAILHGCVVEDDVLVGMGSIVMDNAIVGSGSLVAAGSLLPPGFVVPPASFVRGAPARVVRPVGDRERAMIDNGWRSYARKVQLWQAGRGATVG